MSVFNAYEMNYKAKEARKYFISEEELVALFEERYTEPIRKIAEQGYFSLSFTRPWHIHDHKMIDMLLELDFRVKYKVHKGLYLLEYDNTNDETRPTFRRDEVVTIYVSWED